MSLFTTISRTKKPFQLPVLYVVVGYNALSTFLNPVQESSVILSTVTVASCSALFRWDCDYGLQCSATRTPPHRQAKPRPMAESLQRPTPNSIVSTFRRWNCVQLTRILRRYVERSPTPALAGVPRNRSRPVHTPSGAFRGILTQHTRGIPSPGQLSPATGGFQRGVMPWPQALRETI